MTPEIKRFGEELREFINSDEVFSVLPEGDWGAGGCWILAKALVKYLGPPAELWTVYSETFPAEHVVVKHDDVFFDYNGASTEEEIIAEFKSSYPNKWGIGVAPLTSYRSQRARQGGIPCETEYVNQVLAKLKARFGPHEFH